MHLALAAILACAPVLADAPVCAPDHKVTFKPSPYPAGMIPLDTDVTDDNLAPVMKKMDE